MLKEGEKKKMSDFYRIMLFLVKIKVSDWVGTSFD